MGKQQIVLIVLGILIVCIAIVIGANVFSSSNADSNRNAVISELKDLATLAQGYYRKSISDGGGSNSFIGWNAPSNLTKTVNGVYNVKVNSQSVMMTGIGKEKGKNGSANLKVVMVVAPDRIISTNIEN